MIKEIIFSKRAVEKINQLIAKKPSGTFFRIAVKGGGCSGFKYDFSFDNKIDENDLKSEKVRLKMYDFQQKESFKIILSNIDVSVKVIFKKTLHFLVFDPLGHTYFFHKHDYKTPLSIGYYRSEDHKKFIIPRIIYSLLIYSICLVGFFSSLKIRDKK